MSEERNAEISHQCIALVTHFEGFESKPYQDSVGVWTIGYGTTRYPDGSRVKNGDPEIDEYTAENYLYDHFEHSVIPAMKRYITTYAELNQDQIDAVASWVYNLGAGNLNSSTLLKKLNRSDWSGAADEFGRWVYAGGEVLPGLVRRRKSEAHLFRTGELKFFD